jgi:hypothetical protein
MSDRPCNLCDYKERVRRAKIAKQKVTLRARLGGVDVLVDGKFAVWYMKLPDKCEC